MGEGVANLVSSAMENVTTVFTAAVNMVTGNAIAMVFIGMALGGSGVKLFRQVRRG